MNYYRSSECFPSHSLTRVCCGFSNESGLSSSWGAHLQTSKAARMAEQPASDLLSPPTSPSASLINLCLNGASVGREAAVATWNNRLDLKLSCFPSLTTNNVTSQPAGQELKWVYNLPSNQSLILSTPQVFCLSACRGQLWRFNHQAWSLLISLMNILWLLSKKVEICIIPNHAGLHNENK